MADDNDDAADGAASSSECGSNDEHPDDEADDAEDAADDGTWLDSDEATESDPEMRGLFGDTESLISTMAAIQSSMVSLRESLVSDIEVRRLREDHMTNDDENA